MTISNIASMVHSESVRVDKIPVHFIQLPDALKPDDQTSTSAPEDKPSAFKLRNPVSRSSKYAALCLKFQVCKCIVDSITLAVPIHPVCRFLSCKEHMYVALSMNTCL